MRRRRGWRRGQRWSGAERGSTCEAESVRLKVRLSALVAQLQLIVRLRGPSSSSTEKEAQEGMREGERLSMCSASMRTLPVGASKRFDEA